MHYIGWQGVWDEWFDQDAMLNRTRLLGANPRYGPWLSKKEERNRMKRCKRLSDIWNGTNSEDTDTGINDSAALKRTADHMLQCVSSMARVDEKLNAKNRKLEEQQCASIALEMSVGDNDDTISSESDKEGNADDSEDSDSDNNSDNENQTGGKRAANSDGAIESLVQEIDARAVYTKAGPEMSARVKGQPATVSSYIQQCVHRCETLSHCLTATMFMCPADNHREHSRRWAVHIGAGQRCCPGVTAPVYINIEMKCVCNHCEE